MCKDTRKSFIVLLIYQNIINVKKIQIIKHFLRSSILKWVYNILITPGLHIEFLFWSIFINYRIFNILIFYTFFFYEFWSVIALGCPQTPAQFFFQYYEEIETFIFFSYLRFFLYIYTFNKS